MISSLGLGWVCRNGHWNDGGTSRTVCTYGWNGGKIFPCGAIREPRDLYEGLVGEPSANPTADMSGNITVTEKSGAQRSQRRGARSGGGSLICFRCAELVRVDRSPRMPGSGFENPGTQIEIFSTREELRWHIKNVHEGKSFADREVRAFRRKSEKRAQA